MPSCELAGLEGMRLRGGAQVSAAHGANLGHREFVLRPGRWIRGFGGVLT